MDGKEVVTGTGGLTAEEATKEAEARAKLEAEKRRMMTKVERASVSNQLADEHRRLQAEENAACGNGTCPRLQPGDYVRFHYDSNNRLLAWWHNKDEQPPIRIEPREHLCFFAGHQAIDEFHRSKVRIV